VITYRYSVPLLTDESEYVEALPVYTVVGKPPLASLRTITTWSKSAADGADQVSVTCPPPPVTFTPLTSSGGVRSTTGGGGGGGVFGANWTTTTAEDLVVVFPDASFAVKLTTVVPSGNVAGASFVTVGAGSAMSWAAAEPRNVAIAEVEAGRLEPVVETVIGAGTVRTGGVVSTMSIVNVAVLVLC
jgi:hypothetical protein